MEDDDRVQAYDPDEHKIQISEMVRFLEDKFESTVCPQCGKDEGWQLDASNGKPGDDDELTIYQMDYASGTMFRPFFAMSCNYCGSIRQISCARVKDWLAANPVSTK